MRSVPATYTSDIAAHLATSVQAREFRSGADECQTVLVMTIKSLSWGGCHIQVPAICALSTRLVEADVQQLPGLASIACYFSHLGGNSFSGFILALKCLVKHGPQ